MSFERTGNVSSIENRITLSGGNDDDISTWREAWRSLSSFCHVEKGKTDDYTKDIVLCWVGWVMDAADDITDRIYAAIDGINLTLKDDEAGRRAEKIIHDRIDETTDDPMGVHRAIAADQLERFRTT